MMSTLENIIVDRGVNFIIGLKKGIHIRVVAPVEKRIENLIEYEHLNAKETKREIKLKDKERKDFIRTFFGKDIDDPASYDLILNSANFQIEDELDLILKTIDFKFKR